MLHPESPAPANSPGAPAPDVLTVADHALSWIGVALAGLALVLPPVVVAVWNSGIDIDTLLVMVGVVGQLGPASLLLCVIILTFRRRLFRTIPGFGVLCGNFLVLIAYGWLVFALFMDQYPFGPSE